MSYYLFTDFEGVMEDFENKTISKYYIVIIKSKYKQYK